MAKIKYTRVTTIEESATMEIPDDTPNLKEYLDILQKGFEGKLSLDPLPKEWRVTKRRVRITGGRENGNQQL